MSVQDRKDNKNKPFILAGDSIKKTDFTIVGDAGRVIDIETYTVLAKITASGKLTPLRDETLLTGAAIPHSIYLGPTIPAAEVVAGDVEGVSALVGGSTRVDEQKVIFENAKTKNTAIAAGTVNARSFEDELNKKGIFLQESDSQSGFENP